MTFVQTFFDPNHRIPHSLNEVFIKDIYQISHWSESSQTSLYSDHLDVIQTSIDDYLKKSLLEFSVIYFRWCEMRQEWGDIGRELVVQALSEWLVKDDVFDLGIQTHYKSLGIDQWSESDCGEFISSFNIQCLGLTLDFDDGEIINRLFRFFEIDLIYQGGFYGAIVEFILGQGTTRRMDPYWIYDINSEHIKSPFTIQLMAAVIGHQEIVVRECALHTIFGLKWEQSMMFPYSVGLDMAGNISQLIRQKTLSEYSLSMTTLTQETKAEFIDDLKETVLCHEMGHAIANHHHLSIKTAVVSESSKLLGETSLTTILEVLADLAPRHGDLKGPIVNMIFHSDHSKAQRMMWMYFSDTWFFDTSETFMFCYSACLAYVFSVMCFKGGEPMADAMLGESKDSLYCLMADFLDQCVNELVDLLTEYPEPLTDQHPTLEACLKDGAQYTQQLDKYDIMTEYQKQVSIWARVFELIQPNELLMTHCQSLFETQNNALLILVSQRLFPNEVPCRTVDESIQWIQTYIWQQFEQESSFEDVV